MKTLFSFFRFYYHILRKNPKKYDIAMCPDEGTMVMMTPLVGFMAFLLYSVFTINMSFFVWIPLIIPIFFANCFVVHVVRDKGWKMKLEHDKQRREAERMQREHEEQQRRERQKKAWDDFYNRMQEDIEKEWQQQREETRERQQRARDYYYNKRTSRHTNNNGTDQNRINAMKLMGLSEGFTKTDVKKAYRKLSKVHHPDCGGLEANFIKLTKAYNYLIDRI